jgi:peroxiredoxin
MRRKSLLGPEGASLLATLLLGLAPILAAQAPRPEFKPAIIEQLMPDISLPVYQGGELSLSSLKGKNVIIVVPRFWADVGYYCTICDYQYMNFVNAEQTGRFQEKYNAALVYLFPFGRDEVAKWLTSLPDQMQKIKEAKFPPEPAKLDEKGRARMERWRRFFPQDFTLAPGEVPTPFPILLDAERRVTGALGVFSTNWNGAEVDQGIPSIFIINAKGILMFKYISQTTVDRPSPEYVEKVLEMINSWK